jgi:ceramide glucosyltransferase
MSAFATALGWLFLLLAWAAIGCTIAATVAVWRFAAAPQPADAPSEPVTLLKPLHGLEPCLGDNLSAFLDQDWRSPIQIVAGSNLADDPALALAQKLSPLIVTTAATRQIGGNAKIANLANIATAAEHDVLILSDSDIAVPRDYVRRVTAALAQPGVGAVTCIYRGRGDAGTWSRFAAAGISYQFAPSVVLSFALGAKQACMGSTIGIRRSTLQGLGGFEAFADELADDYAMGAAVRAQGMELVPVPALLLVHGSSEQSFAEIWRHELRWAVTVRGVNLAGHLGSVLTHPLPLSLLACALFPGPGTVAIAGAFLGRVVLAWSIDRWAGAKTAPLWWLPARDLLSFAVFIASFAARSVDWRGARLRIDARGRVTAEPEIRIP